MRKLPAAAQDERRRQVIGLRESGLTYEAIAAQVGLTQTGVFNICRRFAEQGRVGLASERRGPAPGTGWFLEAEQEAQVRALISRHTPDELGLPFDLKALLALARQAKRHGLKLRQAHTRLAKRAAGQVGRYAHARQMRRELKRLKTYLGRVYRDVARKVAGDEGLSRRFAPQLGLTERLLTQERTSKNKLYSLHAPEVVCIAKGKAHRPYEFSSKVALAVTNRESFVLASKALEGNPYDGHTLDTTIGQVIAMTDVEPARIYVDQGYRGHDYAKTDRVFITRQRRGLTPTIRRELRRRSAIAPMIGHMKADGRLGRNHLLGAVGDAINALLVAAGHNLRLVLNWLRLFVAWLLAAPMGSFAPSDTAHELWKPITA